MSEEKLTVAELLARASQEKGTDGEKPQGRRRRRRSVDEGGITVAELTGSIPAVNVKPEEAKHSSHPLDDEDDTQRPAPKDLAGTTADTAAATSQRKSAGASGALAESHPVTAPNKQNTGAQGKAESSKTEKNKAEQGAVVATDPVVVHPGPARFPAPGAQAFTPSPPQTHQPADGSTTNSSDTTSDKIAAARQAHAQAQSSQADILAKVKAKQAAVTAAATAASGETASDADEQATGEKKATADTAAGNASAGDKNTTNKAADAKTSAAEDKTAGNTTPPAAQPAAAASTAASHPTPAAEPIPVEVLNEDDPVRITTGEFPAITPEELTAAAANKAHDEADNVGDTANEEDSKVSIVGVIVVSLVAIGIGIALFKGFELLWGSLNHWVTTALACAVTLGIVGCVHAMRTEKDGLSMFLAALAGIAVTFGPLAIVGL